MMTGHKKGRNTLKALRAASGMGEAARAVAERLEQRTLLSGAVAAGVDPQYLPGEWPTFGDGAAHNGYYPGQMVGLGWARAWKVSLGSQPLNPLAIGSGRVYATPVTSFGDTFLTALDASTGTVAWDRSFDTAFSINPPTYYGGSVYVQRADSYNDSQLWSIDAASGNTVWSAPFQAQSDRYYAPAVCGQGIWIDGGGYGGMYGFTLSGAQIAFVQRPQYDQWSPSILGNNVYSQVGGDFSKYTMTGQLVWKNSTAWAGGAMNRVPALAGTRGILVGDHKLYAVDLNTGTTLWSVAGDFTGSPAVAGNTVYAIVGNTIATFSAKTGAPRMTYLVADTVTSLQPIVTDDSLIVSSANATYVFSLGSGTLRQTINHGGQLSLANGMLYIAGANGAVYAYDAVPAPLVTAITPTLPQQGNVPISYTLRDAGAEGCTIAVEYSTDHGATWSVATPGPGGDGMASLSSTQVGVVHTFVWDSVADLGAQTVLGVMVRVTPNGANAGVAGVSGLFNVKNGADVAPGATVSLSTHSPRVGATLMATATKSDLEGDPVSLTFVWKVNGDVKRTFTSSTALTDKFDTSVAGNGGEGDTISVEVTPNDGTLDGTVASDAATVVANTAPTATVALSAHQTYADDALTATAVTSDANGDPVTLTYVWKVNGVVKQTHSGVAAPTDTFVPRRDGQAGAGDIVTVEVTPNDGEADNGCQRHGNGD